MVGEDLNVFHEERLGTSQTILKPFRVVGVADNKVTVTNFDEITQGQFLSPFAKVTLGGTSTTPDGSFITDILDGDVSTFLQLDIIAGNTATVTLDIGKIEMLSGVSYVFDAETLITVVVEGSEDNITFTEFSSDTSGSFTDDFSHSIGSKKLRFIRFTATNNDGAGRNIKLRVVNLFKAK